MLTQYKNIDKIQSSNKAITANRFTDEEISLFKYIVPKIEWGFSGNYRTELHVYSGDTWVTGNHKVDIKLPEKLLTSVTDPITNQTISLPRVPLSIDLYNEFDKLNLTRGNYRVAFNFFRNLIGSYDNQHLRIDEISPDRTEIRLKAIDATDDEFLEQITNYIQTVNQLAEEIIITVYTAGGPVSQRIPSPKYSTYLLNFGRNKTVMYTNSVVIGEYLYVKLKEPLPADIQQNFKCWVVQEIKSPVIDRVSIQPEDIFDSTLTELSGPNWDAISKLDTSTDTGLKTWNDLLGSSVSTSQQLVDSIFSGSLSGINLNIDYEDFNNFIFYGSALERVKNFHYKISLIEYYESQIVILNSLSGSQNNVTEYTDRKTKLVSGFDSFEKFLYYESSSGQFSNVIPSVEPNVSFITGSYITPWPKSNSTKTYTLYPISSSQITTWYQTLIDNAVQYDNFNKNALVYAIPEFIRTQPGNEGLDTFISMLGQHYDILYTYINHMSKIHSRDEHPKYGVPNELLYSVAKQFGWSLTDGNQYKDLWEYVLGTNEAGIPITGSNSVGDPAVPGQEMTYHVWRRIVNNLPLLLKSKGTKRSIKALLSCYGIPQSMITIQEYGGPRLERPPVYEKLNFDYALDLITNPAGTVTVNYDHPINSIELRFKTDNVLVNPSLPNTMNLFSVDSTDVTLDFTRGTLGTIQVNGTSSADIEMFDGEWLNVLLRSGSEGSLEVVAKKSKYGKIVAAVSASLTASFASAGTITLGSTSGGSRLQGQLQELRLWTSSLGDSAFNNHTKAPAAYDGNADAYDELVFRVPLTQKIDHALTSSLTGVEPKASGISASFASWTNSQPYDSIEETYYYDGISLAAGTYDDNKIRIEENELVGTLDVKTRAERSQFDKAPLDSKKLGVYFSPQTMINDDIIAHLGFTELDSYIGDPGQAHERSYPDLINAAQSYWKKYDTKNDINAYIKIFSLFDLSFFNQLEQLLPARVDKVTGVLVQPNILERNKDSILPRVNKTLDSYNTIVDINETTIVSGSYPVFLGSVQEALATVSAQDDDQWQGYLTKSSAERYNGTTYSYDYLFWNGTEYVAGSTPQWESQGIINTISSSRLSTERESATYTEYRNFLYSYTHPIESGSTQSTSNTGSVFESFEQSGSATTYTTSSILYVFNSSAYSTSVNPDNPYNLGGDDVNFIQIVSSSTEVTLSQTAYLREITLEAPVSSPSLAQTISYYEVINDGAGDPLANGGNLFWSNLYQYLNLNQANTEYPETSSFFSMPIAVDLNNASGNWKQLRLQLYIGSGSTSTPDSGFVSSIESAITTFTLVEPPGDTTYTGSLTFDTSLTELAHAMERSGSWAAPGTTVYAKLSLLATPKAASSFNGDTIKFQKLGHTGTALPTSYILANISSSRTDASTIYAEPTSSTALYPSSIWYTKGTFDTDLNGIDTYSFIPSASRVTFSISSSISASLANSIGDNLIEFTGFDITVKKWGVTGSLSQSAAGEPLQIQDNKVIINDNSSSYITGSTEWYNKSGYPTDGVTTIYGNPYDAAAPIGAPAIDTYIRDLIFTQVTYSSMSLSIQPEISSSLYLVDTEVARSVIDNVTFYYTYSGSAVPGSSPIGYIVVSGSDILTADAGIAINGPAEYQDFVGTGLQNSFYNGTKISSKAFNVSSIDTIDGGPVVETRETNPNQLIYQSPNDAGSFSLSGRPGINRK